MEKKINNFIQSLYPSILLISFLNNSHRQILEKMYWQVQGLEKYFSNSFGLVIHDGLPEIKNEKNNFFMYDYRNISAYHPKISKSKIKIDLAIYFTNRLHPNIIYKRYTAETDIHWLRFVKKFQNVVFEHQTKELEQLVSAGYSKQQIANEIKYGKEVRKRALALVGVTPEIAEYEKKISGSENIPTFVCSNGINVDSVRMSKGLIQHSIVNCLVSANFRYWHGLDRIVAGLIMQTKTYPIMFHIVGDGPNLGDLLRDINDKNLSHYFRFYGYIDHESIDNISDFCDVGISVLGLHRKDLKQASPLKNREYCARGLPFVCAFDDCDFDKNIEFIMQVPADDSPIRIEDILSFAIKFKNSKNIRLKMREYAAMHLDWDIKMQELSSFFKRIGSFVDNLWDFDSKKLNSANKIDYAKKRTGGSLMLKARRIVLFGAGEAGKKVLAELSAGDRVVAIADNAISKIDTFFCGHQIIAPSTLNEIDFEKIIVASMHWEEIVIQLESLGYMRAEIEIADISHASYLEMLVKKAIYRDRIATTHNEFKQAINDYKCSFGHSPDFIMDKPAPMLPADALKHVRVYPNRHLLMLDLPKNARVAELGTEQGNWAHQILASNPPSELHLFDLSFEKLRKDLIDHKKISLHVGDSAKNLAMMPDAYFDWLYIDGDHTYRGVSRDIEQAVRKMKPEGWLVFNDYTVWSWIGVMPYGVVTAVNELILSGWEMRALGLNPTGYWEVALQRKS